MFNLSLGLTLLFQRLQGGGQEEADAGGASKGAQGSQESEAEGLGESS